MYQWIDDGRIVPLEDGAIDADQAHATLDANLDQAKGVRRDGNATSSSPAAAELGDLLSAGGERSQDAGGDPAGAGSETAKAAPAASSRDESGYWEHKARREKAEAQLSEMKALQTAGALVSALGVAKEQREIWRMLRNALLAIPDRTAPVLDPASPSRAHKLLTDELQRVIREFTGRLDERAAAAATAREPDTALL